MKSNLFSSNIFVLRIFLYQEQGPFQRRGPCANALIAHPYGRFWLQLIVQYATLVQRYFNQPDCNFNFLKQIRNDRSSSNQVRRKMQKFYLLTPSKSWQKSLPVEGALSNKETKKSLVQWLIWFVPLLRQLFVSLFIGSFLYVK